MLPFVPRVLRTWRQRVILTVPLLVLLLAGCAYIDSALPPSPSPFPTLARLPTVTPITPSPTLVPSNTPQPATPTPVATPVPLLATVVIGANVRTGPGTDFAVVTTLLVDTQVVLIAQRADWYQISTPDGLEGWMSAQVLDIDPEAVPLIPTFVPDPQPESE